MNSSEKIKKILESNFFDSEWYFNEYLDVIFSGLTPAEHYVNIGYLLNRNPSPRFDSKLYKEKYKISFEKEVDALLHYETEGRSKKYKPQVPKSNLATDPAVEVSRINSIKQEGPDFREVAKNILLTKLSISPNRLYGNFDNILAREVIELLASLKQEDFRASQVKATVIMPTYNRADKIRRALMSVFEQSHSNFELIVVDDGSTDGTDKVLQDYETDTRLRIFNASHGGVSAARNLGLQIATGSVIFYLDSDNAWTPDYLRLMLISLDVSGADCAYAASRLQDGEGNLIGYRGEPFSWSDCLHANYIDMNVFCHQKTFSDPLGPFDTSLKRMVDWDFILRLTKNAIVAYSPFIGCLYVDDSEDKSRVTTSAPYLYRHVVHRKNMDGHVSTSDTVAALTYKFAIKIPAPYDLRMAWGDYHYAESLKAALENLGHSVRLDFLGTWYDAPVTSDHVVIALRGLTRYEPRPEHVSLIWNISHPDRIPYEEYTAYHGIFVASQSYAALLAQILDRPVYPLLQCTDTERFRFETPQEQSERGVFVGNSRNVMREIVKWACEAELPLDVYGEKWENFIPNEMIKAQNVPNSELRHIYSAAAFVLNDHWASMREFGFVSNRVFDVLGCGGRLISDHLPLIPKLFGDAVLTVHDGGELQQKLAQGLVPLSPEARRAVADLIHQEHTFDARAAKILDWLRNYLCGEVPPVETTPDKIKLGILPQHGRFWPTSSAFIRLIAPLTTDAAHVMVDLVVLKSALDPQIDTLDACIVQRIAIPDQADAQSFITRLERQNIPLFVDTDDAFSFHDTHNQAEKTLRYLMGYAREIWVSTPALALSYEDVGRPLRVVPNDLDARFWRNYRTLPNMAFGDGPVRFVYMGTATHDHDFNLVLPAFEKLAETHEGQFELTLIGATRYAQQKPWLHRLPPPRKRGDYPNFVRWFVNRGPFDVGIAPLQETPFNSAKSDVKFLDYSAIGLLSVVSCGPAYSDVLSQGLAVGCEGNTDSWYDAMVDILENRGQFNAMRQKAYDLVWQQRNTNSGDNPMVARLTEIVAARRANTLPLLHPMVLEGKDGWLFLRSDSNKVLLQITGKMQVADGFEDSWRRQFQERSRLAREGGYRYFHSIVPNKECVYAQFLPDGIVLSSNRPVHQVLMAADGLVPCLYHLDLLRDAARTQNVFSMGDTHWNHWGAFVTFNQTMAEMGLPPIGPDEFQLIEHEIDGDLSGKIGQRTSSPLITFINPAFQRVYNNDVKHMGNLQIYENEDKTLPKLVMFRDSFSSHQLEMFAARFSRAVFVWQPNIDYSIIAAEAPDIVIVQQIERFVVTVPDDENGLSVKDHERRKLTDIIS
ncbi:MAG: glycosyl transferase [Cypionkella sp.]|uniref:glycosyltransferase n=1 Tax=Cypionkella sp. TaxID=2811411 RepID=UPI00261FDA08|nr:glycosyltransferase [Cypionkella sp.]MDB5661604.1 glycosyl transferase [Cypionkella sp.]